jgi:diguanylate cyclase (GGDEF)-like protein
VAFIGVDLNTAKFIAEDLRKLVEKLKIPVSKNKKLKITISIGVVEYSQESSLNELINKGDKAMYKAKKMGKNRVVVL